MEDSSCSAALLFWLTPVFGFLCPCNAEKGDLFMLTLAQQGNQNAFSAWQYLKKTRTVKSHYWLLCFLSPVKLSKHRLKYLCYDMVFLAVMNAFKVSHSNVLYDSQRLVELVSNKLDYIFDSMITCQSEELGFDAAEQKKVGRNFWGRRAENEVAAPEGGVVRLMQFRDNWQKCRVLQQMSASAGVAFDGWRIRYACLHCQAEAYRIVSTALRMSSRSKLWKLKEKNAADIYRFHAKTVKCVLLISQTTNEDIQLVKKAWTGWDSDNTFPCARIISSHSAVSALTASLPAERGQTGKCASTAEPNSKRVHRETFSTHFCCWSWALVSSN